MKSYNKYQLGSVAKRKLDRKLNLKIDYEPPPIPVPLKKVLMEKSGLKWAVFKRKYYKEQNPRIIQLVLNEITAYNKMIGTVNNRLKRIWKDERKKVYGYDRNRIPKEIFFYPDFEIQEKFDGRISEPSKLSDM
jgi:hypothetical protein